MFIPNYPVYKQTIKENRVFLRKVEKGIALSVDHDDIGGEKPHKAIKNEKRKCAECPTLLSRYNSGDKCSLHERVDIRSSLNYT